MTTSIILTDEQIAELKIKCIEWVRNSDNKRELAERCWLSESSLFYYMQWKKSPSYLSTLKLAEALKIEIS